MSLRIVYAFLLVITLSACTDLTLYSGLMEKEANEIVALLYNAGIYASKNSDSNQTYSVSTSRENFSQAIELLRSNGYPRNRFESLGDVFKKEGFVSSPLEERARLNYAQSQELSRTIESIDGVILARVHLAIPEDNKLTSNDKPSSASVFIKHRRGIDLSGRESQIKALIVNSIEGLPYENVTVAMFSSDVIPVSVKNDDNGRNTIMTMSNMTYLLITLSTVVIVLAILIVWLWVKNRQLSPHPRIANIEH